MFTSYVFNARDGTVKVVYNGAQERIEVWKKTLFKEKPVVTSGIKITKNFNNIFLLNFNLIN